jgi:uncharacterized protein YndB with AHSA1/START domain
MLVTLVVIAVVALSAFLLYVSRKPDTFRIERSTTIKAAPQAIFPLINDLHSHGLWSPFDTDPATKRTFTGSAAGRGQVYQWDGSRKAGAGTLTITDSAPPSCVTMNLDMTRPFPCHNVVEFTLAPEHDGTRITWAMRGPVPFMGKLMSTFMNCDKMMQVEFDKGLASMKALAERADLKPAA